MSDHEVLQRKHFSNSQSSRSNSTIPSRSCGHIEKNQSLASEPTRAKTVQYPARFEVVTSSSYSGSGEYYKRYDYDLMPVKDDAMTSETSTDSGKGERIPITNSHLEKLEKTISEELRTDSSYNTLDSSIKFFKVTVEEIFSKFYTNMQDFELYKKKFHEILSKDQENCVEEMEDFIKDMIHHIMSSESSDFNANHLCNFKVGDEVPASNVCSKLENLQCVTEAFKNDNFLESASDEKGSGSKQEWKDIGNSSETFNIYLLSENPCVKIKMNNNRNFMSEIQIMERTNQELGKAAASADNIKRLAAKKSELDKLEEVSDTCDFTDLEIPVKFSFAKKNIHSEENIHGDSNQNEKSFLAKLCSFLCKKIRKATGM